ncbi:MAG: homocysteine S-methyltransferase family protein [Oscillospiraceae bacterium]|jgi:5-methyltetrahydrofolate--homocysteine methyltransferase|nr:homocysteine S-methyltransferase family protein [Oscillospiraceae bacterium]
MNIRELVKNDILIFDGAMGTMLQQAGLPAGAPPEVWAMERKDVLLNIHRAYVEAGADVITANTFQANELKLGDIPVEEAVAFSVRCAKESGARFVALDIGPTGQMLEPMGSMTFDEAYRIFARQMICGEKSGADCIIIETFSDLYEAKAAVLAARENTSLPVICTLTFQEDGRTFVGCDPVSAAVTLSGLGADALGVNCSLGPGELLPVVEKLLAHSVPPVIVQANAGLPRYRDGETVYDITPGEYAAHAFEMARRGVRILGGCCGTTPEFIREVKKAVSGVPPVNRQVKYAGAISSGVRTVFLGDGVAVIGERINPTGKKKLREALKNGDLDYILGEGTDQAEAGCDALDVNVGLPELDEPAVMARVTRSLHGVVNLPLQIDSADPAAIEAGVRACTGRPIINSVNGKASVMAEIFPIAQKYGAVVVGLTLDENGIPPDAEGRLAIARRIVETAGLYGIAPGDLLIDCLTLAASAQQDQVMETLKALRLVKKELGVHTVLGVSNVSFGLPAREIINATFLAAALGAGLDAPILNPLSERYMEVVESFRVLSGEDKDSARFTQKRGGESSSPAQAPQAGGGLSLRDIILQGRREEAAIAVKSLLETLPPMEIVTGYFIPSLDIVGERFEKGEIFLPQLIRSADTVKNGFEILRERLKASGEEGGGKGPILLATVHGDIHDIGKNIVKMLLENYGYDIIDLGRDVPPETVVEAILERDIRLAGLSALMTTTVRSMGETIGLARKKAPGCRFFVGGAVLNPEYAQMVGADFYARDAMESVEIAKSFFK